MGIEFKENDIVTVNLPCSGTKLKTEYRLRYMSPFNEDLFCTALNNPHKLLCGCPSMWNLVRKKELTTDELNLACISA